MKNSNLLNRLLSYSHEKQKMGGMRRYAAVLLMLLTLGVGQMWAAVTIYYVDKDNWGTVKCHHWKDGGSSTTWPGSSMSDAGHQKDGHTIYSITFNDNHDKCIFNNGSGKQTGNISISNGKVYYNGSWYTYNSSFWDPEFKEGQYIYINYSTSTWGSTSAKFRYNWNYNTSTYCCYDNESGRVTGENYAYAVTPNSYVRAVQILRFNSTYGTQWNYTKTVAVSSQTKNCINLTASVSNDYTFTWGTYAPPLSSVSLSDNGTAILAGGGTESNPYLIATGATIKVVASGTKAVADPDATIWYDIKDNTTSKQNSSTAACSFTASATANTVYQMKVDGYTKVSSTSSTKLTSDIIYYKTVSVKDISVYIYVGGHSDGEINSVEMNGCIPYVGTKALTAVKINNRSAGEPKFTLSGNWLVYTFTNVTKVSNITCARSGGNIFTGEITDNVYYTYEGTSLPGQCIQPANPTWGTAPANGAIGGNMTATVSGAPDGATITWSSTATSYATVNSSGVISYVAAGSATIKAHVQKAASGDYCALDYTLSQDITVTSGATVSATRTCPEYVSTAARQVSMHITFTGTSSGWVYCIKHGWDTGYEVQWVDASGSSADWTKEGGVGTGEYSFIVELYDRAYGTLIASSSPVTVIGEISEFTNVVAGSNGSVSPSGQVWANTNHVHPTITATPDDHYHFVNWTSSNNTYTWVSDPSSASSTLYASASNYTITANFAGDQYSITYKDQGDVAYSGSNEGSLPATHTYGTATALVNGTKNGYNFVGWYTDASCTISAGSSIGATAKTSNFTLYAKWTENMSSLSTSCSYDAGTPGYAAPTVSNSATNVGYVTTRTITATAAGTGYTFAGWTLTNCTRTDGGGATANPITIRSNGDGAAVSVVANYNEDLSSPYTLKGGTNVTGDNWATAHNFTKKTGHSTESVAYCTFNVASTNSGISGPATNWSFKVLNGSTWYGLSADGDSWWYQRNSGQQTLSTSGKNIQLCADVAGPYEIKVDYTTPASPKVTVTFPTSYTLTYAIGSVNGTSGTISTSPSTESGSKVLSGNTVTLTAPDEKTGYTWKGWYLNSDGSGVQQCATKAYAVTMNANKTLYACYTENTYNVSASATPAGYGTVTPTSSTSMGQINGGNIKASPNAGYSFSGWSIASGSGYFGASGTATTSATANTKFRPTANATLTGTFAEVLRTVTVDVNNSYLGSVSTTSLSDVGPVTKSAEVTATPETGASFTNWTLPSGVTAADGYSASSNPIKVNATAGSKTITANFTETTYTVSMSTADASKGTVADASKSVGQITAVQITATPKSGYMFSKWVKTAGSGTVTYYTGPGNGQVTDASGEEKETTYICVTGNVTLQATWEADRSSGYVVHYGNSGKNADGGTDASQTRPWKDGKLYRATTEASDVSYFTFTAGVGDVDKTIYFKIWETSSSNWDHWYGYNSNDGGKITGNVNEATLSTSYGDARLCITMPGNYVFTWNSSAKTLSVAYPTNVYYLRGGFNGWSWAHPMTETSSGVYSATVNMTEANHTYSGDNGFKLLIAGQYYGKNSTTVTRSTSTGSAAISSCATGQSNIGITTDYTGDYTFTYTVSTNTLQVTYPTAYTVTYGVGTGYSSMGSVSTSPSVTSGRYVLAGSEIAFTATPNLGYKFVGWYREAACTNEVSTDNPYEPTINATTTLYAKFDYRPIYIHADFAPNGWSTPVLMTQSTANRAIYTYTTTLNALASAQVGGHWNTGYHFHFVNTVENPNANKAYTYDGVQTPTSSGCVDAIHKTADKNPTIEFGLTNKAFVTITLTLKSINDATKPTVNIAADRYYDINYTAPSHGSYTIQVGAAGAVSANTEARAGTTITLANTPSTGYSFGSWTVAKSAGTVTVSNNQFTMPAEDVTVSASFTPNTYQVRFHRNGGSGVVVNQNFTYDVAQNLTANTYTKTGYNFAGWALAADAAVTYADEANVSNLTATNEGIFHLYAKWTPMSCAVEFDFDESDAGFGNKSGATTDVTATYDAAMTSVTPPTAANGYAFMGYFDDEDGEGTQYYNADGTSAHAWDKATEDNVTLFAYYKKAEITLAFDDEVVLPGGTVGVTPTISPTPVGNTIICWTILHSNDTPLDPQPAMTWSEGKLTFAASSYSGTYKVQAVLRTGTSCGGGDPLDTETANFQVAGTHNVTVNYKCGDDVIKASTILENVSPMDWTEEFTAPEIFGYTFARWDAVDGVTIKNGALDPVTTSTNATIQIKATYAGKLTAVYTQNQMIFFKNTLGWSNVFVNFHTGNAWNNTNNPQGSPKGVGNSGLSTKNRNNHMIQIGESDIYYYDYGAESISPSLYISFTNKSRDGVDEFWGDNPDGIAVVYPANYPDAISTDRSAENGFKAATPMFVPLASQEPKAINVTSTGKANYYNAGYWTKYLPGTGYTLEIYNNSTGDFIKSETFTSGDELMPMKAVVDLEGGTTYKFQLRRGGTGGDGFYYGNTGTMTYANHGQDTPWSMTNEMDPFKMVGITTNAAGSYTFNLSYSANSKTEYRLRIAVDYPVSTGDYRLIYSDAVQTKPLSSAIITKKNDGSDTTSFFVRPGSTPVLRIQQATVALDGTVTWNEYPTIGTQTNQITGDIASAITAGGTEVYNFNLSMDGSGALTVTSAEIYEGNFYIRTDAANSKWDNYRSDPDHLMTYSEYSITHGGYTHYYTHWVDKDVTGRKNVKFVIANDYSPNISDTLAREAASGTWEHIADFMEPGGDLKRSANVRYMWDKRTNAISRAYVDGAQTAGTRFLTILSADAKILNPSTEAVQAVTTFSDKGNWMYEANIKAKPLAEIKLKSSWGKDGETAHIIDQYFKGAADATEQLIGGSGSDPYDIRLIYDFKTNRLIAGLIPSGNISDTMPINADVMFIREHHGDIAQLTFSDDGAITEIKTAFGVLQFNKWTINNKSKESGHSPLSPLLSNFERDLFYVSFPFKVAMEDVFGFGTYGQHWIIEEYDGATRAKNGYWQESGPNWKFVFNRKDKYFEPGQGYIIALDLDELGESSSVWTNTDRVELYFPSYGTMDNITSSTATYEIPSHLCTIDRSGESNGQGGTLGSEYDRRVKDSHWNVLGVPTYVNPDAPDFANTAWTTTATETSIGPNFLYEWNKDDNTMSAVSASGYTYHAMHAYLVQYCGNVTWTSSVSVKPSDIVARRMSAEKPQNVEFKIELSQNDKAVDQTYIKLSDDERVTTDFEFNYDLSKEYNKNKANIYTLIGTEPVAGNVLPLTEQTTVIPVGVKIAANGDYTFAIPEGTDGIGITLIDNGTGIRTSLSALDYTINLNAGTYNDRFLLEISPVHQSPTGIELLNGENGENGVRKVLIDNILYIVKDGVMYDARGSRVQ